MTDTPPPCGPLPAGLFFDPAWRTPDALALARACYERREGQTCGRCEGRKWEHFRPTPRTSVSEPCPGCGGTGRVGEGLLDPARLAVLADALEEAGCPAWEKCGRCEGRGRVRFPDLEDEEADCDCPDWAGAGHLPHPPLAHLRGPGPHARGCWVLDLLLGKS